MLVLVAGATGKLGGETVRRLRASGHDVRALARPTSPPDRVADLERSGATIARGDLKDPASLAAACKGVDAVISTVSIIATAREGDSFEATDGAGTVSLIDAAVAADVRHFVFVSFDVDSMPDCPLAAAKRRVEQHLMLSGLTWTILRPTLFMELWLGPLLFADPAAATAKVYGAGEEKIRYVSVPDVAEVVVQSLAVPEARDAIIGFGGPDGVSQRDAVRIFEEAYGRPFEVAEFPETTLEAQWETADTPFAKTFSALMLGVARGVGSQVQPPTGSYSIAMTSVKDFVRAAASGGTEAGAH